MSRAARSPTSRPSHRQNHVDTSILAQGTGGNEQLEKAIERADLRQIIDDFYPDAGVNLGRYQQRVRAVWRGGDNPEAVALTSTKAHDFKDAKTWNAWTFLTEVVGFSRADAASYLLERAGLASTPSARRVAVRRERAETQQQQSREAYLRRELDGAHHQQRTGATTGGSVYLERKDVHAIFETHEVAGAIDPTGAYLPGLTYGSDRHGEFIQLALRTLDGAVTGYQRVYNGQVLPGNRDKHFYGATQGAFVLLQPKGFSLPRSGETLAAMLEAGYEVAICEGAADGMSVALARPRAFVFCALSAHNLGHVAEALRSTYGYTRTRKTPSGGRKRVALDVTIWGDFDESGTGQHAAHRAALEHDCYVRLPRFKGGGYGDFNDLHAARGLEAVRRTRRTPPDATLAFAKELSKQKLSDHKHVAPFTLPRPGEALIVRAPQEGGKTHQLAKLLADSDLRGLVVTHRESLAKNLAERLGFECYTDYPAHMLRDIPRLVICFDSLHKLGIGGKLPPYDLLGLDESEQVLEHITGRHIKHKAASFGVLEHYLTTQIPVIALDANAGRLTEGTLHRFNPERKVGWHRHEYHVAAGRQMQFVYERDDALDALEAEQRPTWYSSDSLRHTRDLSAYLDDPDTLTINSETSTTDAAAKYLLDPTGQAPAHRRMIASPTVQTGISDDSGHWPHVIGSFTGHSSTPQNAMQSLIRARGAPQVTVHAPRGRGEALTIQDALEGAANADTFEAEALGRATYGTANPNYERLRAEVEAQRTRRQASYKKLLVLEAARLGYTIKYDLPRDLSSDELERRHDRRERLKKAGLELYVQDRVSAERIDEARAKELDEAYVLAQADRFALEQYQLRAFYQLPADVNDTDLAEMLRQDDYKALRRQVQRYENFIEPRAVAEARARGELDVGVLKGDARLHMLHREYHQRLGELVGLNSATEAEAEAWEQEGTVLAAELQVLTDERSTAHTRRKGEIDRLISGLERRMVRHAASTLSTTYSARSAGEFMSWCCAHYQALRAAGLVTGSEDNLKSKIVEVIGDSLRRCGLEQQGDGQRAGRSYAVTLASISVMRGYSRPRRTLWGLAQQTNITDLDNGLLHENAEKPSQTGLTSTTLDPNANRLAALDELLATLPDDKRAPAHDRFSAYLIDRRRIDAATPDELRADAAALRACARAWRAGQPSNPARFLSMPPPTFSAAPSAQGSA